MPSINSRTVIGLLVLTSVTLLIGWYLFTLTPEPIPSDTELAWAITFEVTPSSGVPYAVTKVIGLVHDASTDAPGWEEIDRVSLSCTVFPNSDSVIHRAGTDYIQFMPGSYIECKDIDLAEFVQTRLGGELGDYIGREICMLGPSDRTGICMQTEKFYLWANIAMQNAVDGDYPIFTYPQTVPDGDDQVVLASTVAGVSQRQSIDFGISYLGVDEDVHSFGKEEWRDGVWDPEPRTPEIRWENDASEIRIRFSEGDDFDSSPLENFNYFEFRNVEVPFYFGDKYGMMPDGTSLKLYSLVFDPNDSCGTCN